MKARAFVVHPTSAIALLLFLTVLWCESALGFEAPTKEACDKVFKTEKAAMNACVEKNCKGKDQQHFQECHSACALERSEKYQACYSKFVLGM